MKVYCVFRKDLNDSSCLLNIYSTKRQAESLIESATDDIDPLFKDEFYIKEYEVLNDKKELDCMLDILNQWSKQCNI
jgi:hypothetical protein